MVVESTTFGQLEICDDEILRFADGLPGFPAEKAFALLPYGPDNPFAFLQSITNPHLIFLVVDPFTIFKDYEFALDDDLAREMGLSEVNPPKVLNIVTINDKLEDMTANLLAPVVVNLKTRAAVQIVLEKTPYATRHLLFPSGLPKKAAEGGK